MLRSARYGDSGVSIKLEGQWRVLRMLQEAESDEPPDETSITV
jgi:hypothetical protein